MFRWFFVSISLASFACSGTSGDKPDPTGTDTSAGPGDDDDDDVTDTEDPTGATGDTGPSDTGTEIPGVSGRLVGPDGAPMADTDVLCCTIVTCYQAPTNALGRFVFEIDPGTPVAIKTHEVTSSSPRLAAALVPAVIGTSRLDSGDVYVPALPVGAPLEGEENDPQTLSAGDGLELTLSEGDLVPPFGVFLSDVAAASIPSQWWPSFAEAPGDVVAEYAVHPFGTASTSPIGVRAPTSLPAGTRVVFYSVDELDGTFDPPAPGSSDGTYVQTDPGAGVLRLTHIVVTLEGAR